MQWHGRACESAIQCCLVTRSPKYRSQLLAVVHQLAHYVPMRSQSGPRWAWHLASDEYDAPLCCRRGVRTPFEVSVLRVRAQTQTAALRRQSGFTLVFGYEGSNRSNHHMLNSSTCHLTAPLSLSRLRCACLCHPDASVTFQTRPPSPLHSTPPRPSVVITPLRPIGRDERVNGLPLPHTPTLIRD